jgi:hypothetical protein
MKMGTRIYSFVLRVLFVCLPFVATAQSVDHWETVVYDSSVWHYFPGTASPGSTWMNAGFNDTGWTQGKGGFGYGDNDDRTVTPSVISVFLRKTFSIADVNKIGGAMLHVDYDDGYVAYLNGIEIARRNISGVNPMPYDQTALVAIEPVLPFGGVPEGVYFSKQQLEGLLVAGNNVLAVEVHNSGSASSDLSSSTFLSVGITDNTTIYGEVPIWFEPPFVFSSSTLPVIVINSDQAIQDDPRIMADMGIIDNGSGNVNNITDPFNDYVGKIGIEIRGESSQMFPKKSYLVETIDDAGNNRDVSLLGLPAENDWILYAPYTDKTLMRDVITYEWGRKLGMYASRVRYVELVINGDYKGVYVLLEKIKRNKNRVDIAALKPTDISGDDLTGGYLLRVDKWDANDYPAWTSTPTPKLPNEPDVNFQFHDPKGEELLTVQQNYIKNYVLQFESVLSGTNFKNATTGYRKYIDVPSFVDFTIINEIGKNIDGYVFSTYLFKEKDSKGGKLHMGPLWDFNLAYGNVDYLANSQFAPGWTFGDNYRMYWFRRLVQDPYFSGKMNCRWSQLRSGVLSNIKMMNTIDSIATVLEEPQKRNYKRWPILDTYVWPNQYWDTDGTYQAEVNFLKQWITNRVIWMDNNMVGECGTEPGTVTGIDHELDNGLVIYPNPSSSSFHFILRDEKHGPYTLNVYNNLGEIVFTAAGVTEREVLWDAKERGGAYISSGLYTAVIRSGGKTFTAKLVKQ